MFFLLPIFPSLSTYTVTIPFYILTTRVEIPPSAIRIFLPTSVEVGKSLYEQAIR